jgi:hypothetical protein
VVPREGRESTELHPSVAELFVGVSVWTGRKMRTKLMLDEIRTIEGYLKGKGGRTESADISTDHRDTVKLELEETLHDVSHVLRRSSRARDTLQPLQHSERSREDKERTFHCE